MYMDVKVWSIQETENLALIESEKLRLAKSKLTCQDLIEYINQSIEILMELKIREEYNTREE